MQLFAFDSQNRLTPASAARKSTGYFCLECGGALRLRGGGRIKLHYFHLRQAENCRQSGKSMPHLQVQLYLQALFPEGVISLEKRFPRIGRVADVVWEEKRLVFEVQCSPLAAQEVRQRNADYAREGYRVVWILHERRFNRSRVSAAAEFLRGFPHYYTNMDAMGNGVVYDQLYSVQRGWRKRLTPSFRVRLSEPLDALAVEALPPLLRRKVAVWPLAFAGDAVDRYSRGERHFACAEETCAGQSKAYGFWQSVKQAGRRWVVRPYLILLELLLEERCR